MGWFRGFSKKRSGNKGFQPQKNATALQTFILEPILTPSGIIDSGDDSHTSLMLDVDTPTLPEVDLPENNSTDVPVVEVPDVDDVDGDDSDPDTSAVESSQDSSDIVDTDILATHKVDDSISDGELEEISFIDSAIDNADDATTDLETDDVDTPIGETEEIILDSTDDKSDATADEVSVSLDKEDFATDTQTDLETEDLAETDNTDLEVTTVSPQTKDTITDTQIDAVETEVADVDSFTENATIADQSDPSLLPDSDIEEVIDSLPEPTDIPPITSSESPTFTSGVFTVGETGEIGIDFLFDGGGYKGELAIFSLKDMENFTPGSTEFIKEAATRALSSSEFGYVVISDPIEGAKFSGKLPGEGNQNSGDYLGVKTFKMRPGDEFGVMLVPNGTLQQLFNSPKVGGALRPLFSLVTANPNEHFHIGQIADVTGDGNTFVMEDLRVDTGSDRDYNDIIFQVRGATGKAALLDDVIAPGKDWRTSDMGQALIAYAEPYIAPDPTDYFEGEDGELVEIPFDDSDDFPENVELVDDELIISEGELELVDDELIISEGELELVDDEFITSKGELELVDDEFIASQEDVQLSDVTELGIDTSTNSASEGATTEQSTVANDSTLETPKVIENAIAPNNTPATESTTVAEVTAVTSPKVVESASNSTPATESTTVAEVPVVTSEKVIENAIASNNTTVTESTTVAELPVVTSEKVIENAIAPNNITATESTTVAELPVVTSEKVIENAIAPNNTTVTESITVSEVPLVTSEKVIENAIAPNNTTVTESITVSEVPLVTSAKVIENAIAPNNTTVTESITVSEVPVVTSAKVIENAIASNNTTVTESITVSEVPVVTSTKVIENAIAPNNTTVTESTTVAEVPVVTSEKVIENAIAANSTSTTPASGVTTTVTSILSVEKEEVVATSPITINQSSTTSASGVTSTTEVTVSAQTNVASPSSSTIVASSGQTVLTVEQPPVKAAIPKPPTSFDFPKANQPLVGVIDTGFSANNPDIDYSQITLGKDFVDGDDNPLLQSGEGSEHGTHVLGIIAAQKDNDIGINGINDDAPIWVGRAIGSGKWADSLVEFVDAAKESGQPNAVVNLSLDLTQINPDGSVTTRYEFTPQERAAIEYARQNNVLIVVAAGNDGGVMSALGQSSQEFDNIITVGAAERVNDSVAVSKAFDRASYSSYGYGLDIMADGGTVDNPVLSTTGDSVGTMAGTSVASAKVTGAVSQVWAANPNLSYRQVIELLKDTATDLKTPGWDAETGAGFLNMTAAVLLAKVTKPEEYDVLATVIPDTWSGEGKVIPTERAAATEFMGKYYEWDSYTIKSGDSLSAIALRTMGSSSATYYNFIAQKNGIANPNLIYPNQRILIPRQVSAPVQNQPAIPDWQKAIDQAYAASPVNLGSPLSGYLDATKSPKGTTGKFRVYQNGTIHWSPQHGAVPLWLDLQREYNDYGSPNGSGGWLGFPTKREYPWNGGMRTDFEGGYIFWNGRAKAYRLWESPNNTPSQPQQPSNNGQRIIDAVNKVNPDQWYYRPRDITGDRINETFCNWFAADVLDQLGVPIPRNGPSAGAYTKPHPIYGTNTPNKPYGTDQLLGFMNRGGDGMWERVSAADAVASANNGQVVLACSVGHVAVVIPGGSGSNVRIAQAGATNGKNMSVGTGFGSITPTYFRYKGNVKGNVSPNTNTSYSPPATPGQTRQYIVKSGDTLSGIAQRELGNANRWREIKKPNGTTFTEAEARLIKPGQSVYLPVTQQVGTGKPITSTPISVPVQNINLKPGASNLNFSRGQQWITSTGYKFIFQNDGNLVLYNPQRKPIWATGTEGTGADRFSVQADGNVVLYDRNKPVWATDTWGNSGAYFAIQNDGNLVVYFSNGKALFDTGTYGGRTGTVTASPDWLKKHTPVQNIILKPGASNLNFSRGQQWVTSTGYKFIFQNDGNLVLYNPQRKPIWATGTNGTTADRFSVQADGNVVLYDRGKAVWATDTAGNPGAYFAIQNDGNLVVYSSNGKPLFDTVTYGGRTGTVTASKDWLNKHSPVQVNNILARAKKWVDQGIPYNQSAYYQGYRQDCSGFVSMAWQLPTSAVTGTLPQYAITLNSKDELQPGDAINNCGIGNGGHVVLFVKWVDKAQGKFIAYEENGGYGKAVQTQLTLKTDAKGYYIQEYSSISKPWYLERKKS
ncbi:S8 family serine peptidase [Aerosakkonema sp. BLCC-F183]|uniref:S8 family serine peptidase n=1 Tax=Aerosakkonema sp. BLCC-F183 TaxID=3342834 RepID=UPI0035B7BE2E